MWQRRRRKLRRRVRLRRDGGPLRRPVASIFQRRPLDALIDGLHPESGWKMLTVGLLSQLSGEMLGSNGRRMLMADPKESR
jgi:hypothetical protein